KGSFAGGDRPGDHRQDRCAARRVLAAPPRVPRDRAAAFLAGAGEAGEMIARALALVVRLYRAVVSPLFPPACRFSPSCSAYALDALEIHGAWRGSRLIVRRILRCHPFHPGGI